MFKKTSISSPGRICIFGEHQDYLGLPVIPMAINKRLKLHYEIQQNQSNEILLSSNQLKENETLSLFTKPILNGSPYDYLKSVFIYFWDDLKTNIITKIMIDSEITIRGGLSSSAALLTSMVLLIANKILEMNYSTENIAEIAYECEHEIMKISCGRMDQYACAIGGIFHMTSEKKPQIQKLNLPNNTFFIIGNSGIERIADIPLKVVQNDIFDALRLLKKVKLDELRISEVQKGFLTNLQEKRLAGVIGIRDNTIAAFKELKKQKIDLERLGQLINDQQTLLRENYQVSHPKLDLMCSKALDKGALGSKLTGAGFGGSMFALTDNRDNAIEIKEALSKYGISFISKTDLGVSAH